MILKCLCVVLLLNSGFLNVSCEDRISVKKCKEYNAASKPPPIVIFKLSAISRPTTTKVDLCVQSVDLIVGGENAKSREFPHMAAIGLKNGDKIDWTCGGTIISEQYILTAAHCTYIIDDVTPNIVRLGTITISDPEDSYKDFEIDEIIQAKNYSFATKKNDIALIRLKTPIRFSKAIMPACLWQSVDNTPSNGTATGWGRLDFDGENSDILQKVNLQVSNQTYCINYHANIADTQVCAGGQDGEEKDTCQGDSGGPLSHFENCQFHVFGVTSYGMGCGTSIGVYTRVAAYLDWIEKVVWNNQ